MPDALIFIIYVLSFQGIVTSFILYSSKHIRNSENKFLVLFLLAFSLYLLAKNLYWGSFYINNPHFIFAGIALPLLFGPLLFFYVAPKQRPPIHVLHFVPFLLMVIHHIPFYILSAAEKTEFLKTMILTGNINVKFFIYRAVTVLQIVLYVYLIALRVSSIDIKKRRRWYRNLNFAYVGFGIMYIVQMIIYGFFNNIDNIATYFAVFMIIMAVCILFFVTKILLVPELFRWNSKYSRNPLSKEKREQYSNRITMIMEVEQLFLNRELRLIDLAHKCDMTEHQLSQILSECFNMNFFEFVNSYRIISAKQFLLASDYKNYTIDAIAQEVGFKSRSSFYDAFRKFVGTTPSAFKKANLQ